MAPDRAGDAEVDVGGRRLALSNLDKVLWPATGFTKGQMIDYYARVAPVMIPHLAGRPTTLRRWPDGVDGASFFEKRCPSHRPPWLATATMGGVAYCRIDEPAALVWTANLAAIELHPVLAAEPDLDRPTSVVFDLDPGPPADVLDAGRVALILRDALRHLGVPAVVKTSGSKGVQVYAAVAGPVDFGRTRGFALALARHTEAAYPDLVVTTQERAARPGKVLIDWSQNSPSKTTVAVYSLRGRPEPSVSTPVTWDELEAALDAGDPDALRFSPGAVLDRVACHGDLMAPALGPGVPLPELT
jgi:bifunctional non-homologous end joining protein LigD